MKKIILIILLSMNLCSVQAQQQVRYIDPTQFDIAGIKLGMSLPEAIKAITTTLGIDESQIQLKKTISSADILKRKSDTESFIVNTKTGRYTVILWVDIHDKNKNTAVGSITYQYAYNENLEGLYKAALARYGQPTQQGWPFIWCDKSIGNGCPKSPDVKLILKSDNSLKLEDLRYADALYKYKEELVKKRASQQSPAPIF